MRFLLPRLVTRRFLDLRMINVHLQSAVRAYLIILGFLCGAETCHGSFDQFRTVNCYGSNGIRAASMLSLLCGCCC